MSIANSRARTAAVTLQPHTVNGSILIGARERQREPKFHSIDRETGEPRPFAFSEAGEEDVADACVEAEAALDGFSTLAPDERAIFLEAVAEQIDRLGDGLISTAMAETALGRARLESERARTVNQLHFFASVLRQGDWLEATIDNGQPEGSPPRPDLRRMNVALGPVAVFGASNFPLAFSVAGGDTASAFAAGCPVVVKGHPAHPATGELVARAVRAAVAGRGLHEGVFSYLPGPSDGLGGALVADPRIKAVGFTGSRAVGLALAQVAQRRPEPIPVFAEMSSINPVILLPAALAARAELLGEAFVQSLTLGGGQFCTNPGLVIAVLGSDLGRFIASASAALAKAPSAIMLTPSIRARFEAGVNDLGAHPDVSRLANRNAGASAKGASGVLFRTTAATFLNDQALAREVFGPSSLIVCCQDLAEVAQVVESLEGQITISVQIDPADRPAAAELLPRISRRAGRLIANGWPTGVEVAHAMVHGGPYPATSDGRSTSVGSLAMMRFLRPVCWQDVPDTLLPAALRAANIWKLPRRVEGKL